MKSVVLEFLNMATATSDYLKQRDGLLRNRIKEGKQKLSSKQVSKYFRKDFQYFPTGFLTLLALRGFRVLPERFSNASGKVSE